MTPMKMKTIGDLISAIMAIDNEPDAYKFIKKYREWLQEQKTPDTESVIKANVGWCFGEGMKPETITMWVKVCGASHPIFGRTLPTTTQALQMGKKWGRKDQ